MPNFPRHSLPVFLGAALAAAALAASSHADAPAEAPRYAVAVIVEHGGTSAGDSQTGGVVAAPIAKAMLQNLLATNP